MQVVEVEVAKIIPYKNNARKTEVNVQAVAESIKEFGFWQPIVLDKNNIVVCGHSRLAAAKKLSMNTVPCVYADDLTDKQIQIFRLADNKTADISMWDYETLKIELAKIQTIDMGKFGFEDAVGDIDMSISDKEYSVLIECSDEKDREEKLSFFIAQGYKCEAI